MLWGFFGVKLYPIFTILPHTTQSVKTQKNRFFTVCVSLIHYYPFLTDAEICDICLKNQT